MEQREKFGSKMGFVLAAAGSAVGLANLWRFPWLVGEYGGATFILVYLFFLAFLGYPLLLNEIVVGRNTQRNIVGAYKKLSPGKPLYYLGLVAVLGIMIIFSYYSAISGWTAAYTVKTALGVYSNMSADQIGAEFGEFISNPKEVFAWQILFILLTALVVTKGIKDGIEKISKILMPGLFVILILLMFRAVTLEGAVEGLKFYLMPNFSHFSMDMLIDAMGQAFFSLSVGIGGILIYGSYLDKDVDLPHSAGMIAIFDTLVAILGGLVIFPAVFAFGINPGSGPGLAFVTLPNVFNQMPFGQLFGALFFLLLAFASFTTTINMMETFVAYFKDEWNMSRKKAVWVIGVIVIFILGIPSVLSFTEAKFFGFDFFSAADYVISNIVMPLGAVFLAILTGWVWGPKGALEEANAGASKFKVGYWWIISLRYISPVMVIILVLSILGVF